MTSRLLMVVNDAAFFLSHRLPVVIAARRAGYEVHIATPSGPHVQAIVDHGLSHHVLRMRRSGLNPVEEAGCLFSMYRLFRRLQPDLVHLVTIKPVLYGGIAARLARVPAVVSAVSGLGFVFLGTSFRTRLLRRVVRQLYRSAFAHRNMMVIFQNEDDRSALKAMGAGRKGQSVIIKGSGVDLERFSPSPEPAGVPVVTMASRLLHDKGAGEFVEAARHLRGEGLNARFLLVGEMDPGNPAGVSPDTLEEWQHEAVVELPGNCDDVAGLFAGSNIVVLPSYREGMPKVLQEAAASGRAIVTTDVPGCRDAVEPGVSGLLVDVRDARMLASALRRLLDDEQERLGMGEAGRRLAEREFSIEKIVAQHLDVYARLVGGR